MEEHDPRQEEPVTGDALIRRADRARITALNAGGGQSCAPTADREMFPQAGPLRRTSPLGGIGDYFPCFPLGRDAAARGGSHSLSATTDPDSFTLFAYRVSAVMKTPP